MADTDVSALWSPLPSRLDLAPDRVDVIRVALDPPEEVAAAAQHHLDAAERERCARFVRERDRRRFAVAHAALRLALRRYLPEAPGRIEFQTAERGKPHLSAPAGSGLEFNLSHSGERALIAVARGRAVGVDIEQYRDSVDCLAISSRYFSPAERRELHALEPSRVQDGFFACWACKESFIKAVGTGLAFGLDNFDVAVDPGGDAGLLACASDPDQVQRWQMVRVPAEPGYAAALTVAGRGWQMALWDGSLPAAT